MIRLVIADADALARAGLRRLLALEPAVAVMADAVDAPGAVRAVRCYRPDVLLLDLRLPGGPDTDPASAGGLAVLEQLQADDELPPTLVLTRFDEEALLLAALRLGARGVRRHDLAFDQLLAAVRTLAAGGTLLRAPQPVRRAEGARPPNLPLPELSGRERDVLQLLGRGCSNRQIAAALGMAEGTAKNHVASLCLKLGVHDRRRVVVRAAELGYLAPPAAPGSAG